MTKSSVVKILDRYLLQQGQPALLVREVLSTAINRRRTSLSFEAPEVQAEAVAGLLAESYELRHTSPERSLRLAKRALQLTLGLRAYQQTPGYPMLECAVWAYLANAFRINGYFRAANYCWGKTETRLPSLASTPLLQGLIHEFAGAFLRAARHFDSALANYGQALVCYGHGGVQAARVELLASEIYEYRGEPEEAWAHLEKAFDHLPPGGDPLLCLTAFHSMVYYLLQFGRAEEALIIFSQIEWRYRELGQDLLSLRGTWLKGHLALGCRHPEAAVTVLTEVKDQFVTRQLYYDAALAGLDLALALARCERHEEVRRLAEEMLPVFEAHGIEREARMALARWVQAVRQEQTDAETVARVIEELKEIGRRPLDLSVQKPRRR